jgi:hypothetical protein
MALYAAWAVLLEDAENALVLPFGRRRMGKRAVKRAAIARGGDLLREPGVRRQL